MSFLHFFINRLSEVFVKIKQALKKRKMTLRFIFDCLQKFYESEVNMKSSTFSVPPSLNKNFKNINSLWEKNKTYKHNSHGIEQLLVPSHASWTVQPLIHMQCMEIITKNAKPELLTLNGNVY